MRIHRGGKALRVRLVVSITAVFTFASSAVAVADLVVNDVDSSVDSTYESLALTTGGSPTTVDLYVVSQNLDGTNGCNLIGGATLVVGVTSSDTSIATVEPPSITFSACESAGANLATAVAVTPLAVGTASVEFSVVSNDTGAIFNLTTARFRVNVSPPPNTAPSVSVTGVTGGSSYESGSVPSAGCSVADAEDGPSTFAALVGAVSGPLADHGLGLQTATCSFTDAGGLTATASATYAIVDTTKPAITGVRSPDGNSLGWSNGDVTVAFSCADNSGGSGIMTDTVAGATLDSDGVGQAVTNTGSCIDHAGNVADPVTVSGINIDKTAPTSVAFVGGGLTDGGVYAFGSVPAGPSGCTADGEISGLASCSVDAGYSAAAGAHTITATAADNAGNQSTSTLSYTVEGWTLRGFLPPVDMPTSTDPYRSNTVRSGGTVPLKFEVFAGSTELSDTSTVDTPITYVETDCAAGVLTNEMEAAATGGTRLRYGNGGHFIFNLRLPDTRGSCIRVTVTTRDGSTLTAFFRLR